MIDLVLKLIIFFNQISNYQWGIFFINFPFYNNIVLFWAYWNQFFSLIDNMRLWFLLAFCGLEIINFRLDAFELFVTHSFIISDLRCGCFIEGGIGVGCDCAFTSFTIFKVFELLMWIHILYKNLSNRKI